MVAKLVSQNGAVLGLLSMSLHVPARPLKVHAMPTIVQPFWLAAAVVVVVGGVAGMAGMVGMGGHAHVNVPLGHAHVNVGGLPAPCAAAVVVVVGGVAGMAGAQCSAVLGLVGSMCAHMPGRPP